jgi:serine phosphatase RsbU (regulator of sigma subunit)
MPVAPHDSVFCEYYGYRFAGKTLAAPPSSGAGDWIRVVRVDGGFVACVGDACGHGEVAAPLGALMRRAFDKALRRGFTKPEQLLSCLNSVLLSARCLGGATIVRCDGRRIVAAAAGAPPPVVFHSGAMEVLPAAGTILGFREHLELDVWTGMLQPGASLALHTDGISDAEHPTTGEPFPVKRLARLLDPGRSAASNLLACLDAVLEHSGRHEDDLTLLIVQSPESPPGLPVVRAIQRPRAPLPSYAVNPFVAAAG